MQILRSSEQFSPAISCFNSRTGFENYKIKNDKRELLKTKRKRKYTIIYSYKGQLSLHPTNNSHIAMFTTNGLAKITIFWGKISKLFFTIFLTILKEDDG